MTQRGGAILLLLVAALLSGCTLGARPVSLSGVAPAGDGAIHLEAGQGLVVTPSPENHTLAIALAPVAQTQVLQACAGACRNLTVNPGAVIADGDFVGLGNLSLIASSAAVDPALNFYEPGLAAVHALRWSQVARAFEVEGDLLAGGNVTATRFLGTRTLLVTSTGVPFTVSTAPTEGAEVTVFARGSASLQNGTARVDLPQPFQALEDVGNMTVQVTLTSDGPALYVAEKARDHVTVRATGGSTADATFDWLVQAPRKGGAGFVV